EPECGESRADSFKEVAMKKATLATDEEQRPAASHAPDLRDTPSETPLDRITRIARSLFRVPIATVRLPDQGPVPAGEPAIRFCAEQPLAAADGSPLGVLCIADHQPRSLSAEERQLLGDLAALAEEQLRRHGEAPQGTPAAPGLAEQHFLLDT